jgi:hypothetical protein
MSNTRKPRGKASRRHIQMPNGDVLLPRDDLARDVIGCSPRTAQRMNLPTTYIGNVAYVPRDASLQIIADRVKRLNEPSRKRRSA